MVPSHQSWPLSVPVQLSSTTWVCPGGKEKTDRLISSGASWRSYQTHLDPEGFFPEGPVTPETVRFGASAAWSGAGGGVDLGSLRSAMPTT